MRVTKIIEFDAGHRVPHHKSHCKNVHGHRYKLEVTVEGPLVTIRGVSDEGMVLDFSDIKAAMMKFVHATFDHVFIMSVDDPLKSLLSTPYAAADMPAPLGQRYSVKDFGTIQEVPGVPTAENLARWIFELLGETLNNGNYRVVQVKLWETPNSAATAP